MKAQERIDELVAHWREARARGETIAPEALCRHDPELLEAVRAAVNENNSSPSDRGAEPTLPPRASLAIDFDGTRTRPPSSTPLTAPNARPEAIPGYTIIEVLGHGGMGVVYKARQDLLNRCVALKMILAGTHAAPEHLKRFMTEAEAVAALSHANIVQIYEIGTHQGLPYFSMEFVSGGSLTDKVRDQPLPAREAASMVEQIARGVEVAHERGIVHRDLKPENVLLTTDGTPKVTDFGLAKRIESDSGLTRTGVVMGTPSYMAPEQADAKKSVGLAADVWALGAILYRLLTGRPPFQAPTPMDTIIQVLTEEPVPPSRLLPNLPRDLETICMKCLQKEPPKRYANAAALADDLRRFLAGEPIMARPIGRMERGLKWVRRNPVIAGATAIVTLTLLSGTTFSYLKYREAETARQEEYNRGQERDAALKQAREAIQKEQDRVKERDDALSVADARAKELKYQLGVSDFVRAASAFENGSTDVAHELVHRVPGEQRGFEWQYLVRQIDGGIFTLQGHKAAINGVAFSPDGTRIVTGSGDGTAKIWDARTGERLLDIKGQSEEVRSVAFSPDGRWVATAGWNNGVGIWDSRTGNPILKLAGNALGVNCVSFSPDGKRIAAACQDRTVKIWSLSTGLVALTLVGHQNLVRSVSFSKDGMKLASVSYDGIAKVWNAHSGDFLLDLNLGGYVAESVSFSPDGTKLTAAGWSETPKIWDALTSNVLVDLKGHVSYTNSVSFSPDGMRVVSGSHDKSAIVWDVASGSRLVVLRGHRASVSSVAFSPDGMRIVTGSDDGVAKVWDADFGTPMSCLNCTVMNSYIRASFSPDGNEIVTAGGGTAKIWDARTATALEELSGWKEGLEDIHWGPDGLRYLSESDDGAVSVWDARQNAALVMLKSRSLGRMPAKFSPDGRRVVTGTGRGINQVWDVRSGALVFELKTSEGGHTSATFSPDGTKIITCGVNNVRPKVWDGLSGAWMFDLKCDGDEEMPSRVTFSPDGKQIGGSSNNNAVVWDAKSGERLFILKGHSSHVTSIAFSTDGKRIVTSSADGTAKVWDPSSGTPLLDLNGRAGIVYEAFFSADGKRVFTVCEDNYVRIWDPSSTLGLDDLEYHIDWTLPDWNHHRRLFDTAVAAQNQFGAAFHIDRLLAYQPWNRDSLLAERGKVLSDVCLEVRTAFHTPNVKTQPDWFAIAWMATQGDRLAERLMAQKLIADGSPGPALPLLHLSLLGRGFNQPPVEEFLIAQALIDLKKPDEARLYYLSAVDWLDKARRPLQIANIVTGASNGGWQAIAELHTMVNDPRYNEFDWECWYECDVFRARVEKALSNSNK